MPGLDFFSTGDIDSKHFNRKYFYIRAAHISY